MTEHSTLIWLAILTPAIGAIWARINADRPTIREAGTILSTIVLLGIVVTIYQQFTSGDVIATEPFKVMGDLTIAFRLEPLGMIFAIIASFLWLLTNIYAIGYMRGNHEKNQGRFFTYFSVAIGFTMGIAFADNLFTLFVFYEMLTLSTFPLVTHKGDENSKKSGRIYLGILMGTSIGFLLVAIIITYIITGTMDFTVGGILNGKADGWMTALLSFLFVYGIGKAAVMPIHRWLPAAMVAPTPVSALLHAVAVVKAGVFSVLKIVVYIFGVDFLTESIKGNWWAGGWIFWASGATIIIASIIALKQDNLKKRLAYSTISQLSYIVMATAILAPLSVMAAALHIAAHAFGKITLFFSAGSIYTAAHKTNVSQLNGIGHKMPWTMTAFSIGALSMIGVPPTVGFVSKWWMLQGAFDVQNFAAIVIIIISTLLNASYFLPIIYAAFFKKEDPHHDEHGHGEHHADHGEAPLAVVVPLVLTAAGTIILFFLPDLFLDLSRQLIR